MKVSAIIQRHWLPLLGLNSTTLVSVAMIAAFSPRTWTASAQIILPDTTTNLDASLGTLGQLKEQGIAFTNELNPLHVQTSIITSDDVIRPVWFSDPEKDQFSSLDRYKKLFKVKPVDQSTTIRLEVQGSLAQLARQRSERLLKSYERRLNELRQGTAVARQQFSQTQVEQAERNLQLAKNKLAQFKRTTGLVSSEDQTKNLVEAIKTLTTTEAQTLAQAQSAATRSTALSKRLGLTPQQAINSLRLSQNKEYQTIRQKLSELNTAIAVNRGRLTEENPTIKSLLEQRQQLVTVLNKQIATVVPNSLGVDTSFGGNNFKDTTMDLIAHLVQVDSESKALQREAMKIHSQAEGLKTELSVISTQQAELLDLQRKYDIAEGVYKGIVAQLEQAKISAFNSYPNTQVLDQPTVDPKPTSPKLSLVALGGILASVFGSFALVSFLESRNPLLKLKDLEEIELPVLVRIPYFKSPPVGLGVTSETEVEFQRLASTISLMPLENRRLMVSSSTPKEGKTTVTIGLAAALVVLGFRVLMVDADFHKAQLSEHFSRALPSETNALPTPVQVSPGLDLLPVAPKGNGRVMEFVARGEFERHLDAVQRAGHYDYVIVDTAPVAATSEAALMAKAISNVLLVVRLGTSDRYMVQETLEQLTRHNAQIFGLVLNGVEQQGERYVYKQDNSPVKS